MAIPDDIEGLFRAAAAAQRRKRGKREPARRAERAEARAQAARQERARAHGPEAARRVWDWLVGAEGEQLRALARKHRLRNLPLLERVHAHDGSPAAEFRTGVLSLYLVPDAPALRLNYRLGAAWGVNEELADPARLLKLVPPVPLLQLASSIERGTLWEDLREALRGAP